MNKNLIISVLIIAISATLIGGATLAWFTDKVEPIENTFTAGTVTISAEETLEPVLAMKENWNPGDEAKKEFTIINTGTKGIYLRAKIEKGWFNQDGTPFVPDPDIDVVSIEFADEADAENWLIIGDYWYYKNDINGTYGGHNEASRTVMLKLKVTLSGPDTDNQYQGKVFKMYTTFEAIQRSNGAAYDQWQVEYFNPEQSS